MTYKNMMVSSQIFISRTMSSTSFNNTIVLRFVNKFILPSIQLSHYTTNSTNTISCDKGKVNNNESHSTSLDSQNNESEFKSQILPNSLRSKTTLRDLYLTNREVGKKFVTLIKDDLLKNMSHIIELNPGFGFITEELLQIGIPFINLYENKAEYWNELYNLDKRFPNRLCLKKINLFKISKMLTRASESNKAIYRLLSNTKQKMWEEESCMQIIGATAHNSFISHLILSVVFQTGFMMFGRPIFYLAIPQSMYNKFSGINERSTTSCILFNTLFNFEIFGTLDRKAFIPKYRKTTRKNKLAVDESYLLNVIKLEPKHDLFKVFETKKHLIQFWHFVRHHFHKPSTRVIPALEKIMPGCGIRLIAMNYNIFTEFGDLNYNQAYDLYQVFQSWPEFEESTFVLSAHDVKKAYQLYIEEDD